MAFTQQYEEISFSSLIQDIKGYTWEKFRADFISGITVTLVALPQAMAFSLVAGLPMSCGMLAAIFGAIVAALCGSSRFLVVGPTNAGAILVQYATSEIMYTFYRGVTGADREWIALQILSQLLLMVGIFQILAATFKLGRLVQFVSHSVVVGYLVGTALAVIVSQMFTFLGLPHPKGFLSLFDKIVYVVMNLGSIHLPTTIVGGAGVLLMLVLTRINRKIPSMVIMLLVVSISVHVLGMASGETVYFFGMTKEQLGDIVVVGDAGDFREIVPTVTMPAFNTTIMSYLLPISFAIALLGMLETSLVAKTLATNSGRRFAVNQEILGLGLANFFSSFMGALPSSGSPSRSQLIFDSGARTRFASVLSGLGVAVVVLAFGNIVSLIPLTALSAILVLNAMRIVNGSQFLLCFKATYSDAFVLLATLFSCLFFTLDVAFYVGICLSITFYLKKAAEPNFYECTYDEEGRLGAIHPGWKREHKEIRLINVQGELFFGAADLFQMTMKSVAEDDTSTHVIILRLKNARDIDATACLALQQLFEYLRGCGRHLLACGLSHQTWQVLCDSGVVEKIGKENLFILDDQNPRLTLQRALSRARELIREDKARLGQANEVVAEPILKTVELT